MTSDGHPLGPAGYDAGETDRALRLIASRCAGLAGEAALALRSTSLAGRRLRLDRLIPSALADDTVA